MSQVDVGLMEAVKERGVWSCARNRLVKQVQQISCIVTVDNKLDSQGRMKPFPDGQTAKKVH